MSWLIELKGWNTNTMFFVSQEWFPPQLGVPETNNLSEIEAITVPSFPAGDGCNEILHLKQSEHRQKTSFERAVMCFCLVTNMQALGNLFLMLCLFDIFRYFLRRLHSFQ